MLNLTAFLLSIALIRNASAFHLFHKSTAIRSKQSQVSLLSMVSKNTNNALQETALNDIINPTSFDSKRIIVTFAGQAALSAAAFTIGGATGIDVLHVENLQTEAVILQETVFPALAIFAGIFSFSYLLRDVQLTGLQEFFRERKFYVLKTLGLRTDIISAVGIALLIALGEGFSDEVFFRGLSFYAIHNEFHSALGDEFGILWSALISGLAHIPLFGSNFFVESLLSIIYGVSFLSSDFNIIVPMTIHAIYSLVSMYSTWYFSTREINKRIQSANNETIRATVAAQASNTGSTTEETAARFEALAKAIFDIIDLDCSGRISTSEMKLGLRLFGVNADMLDEEKVRGTNYDVLLKLQKKGKDAEISSEEFVATIKEALVTWPKAGANLDYFKL